MSTMPEQLARSLTWDRGKETSALARFKIETGIPILCLPPVALATRYETRTPIALCANTSRKALISRGGPQRRSRQSLTRSTPDPATHSAGRPPPTHPTSSYSYPNTPVLHPPIESGQYTSTQLAYATEEVDVRLSAGRTGVCWDNAQPESFRSTLKTDFHQRHQFPTRADAIHAVSSWIDTVHSALGQIPPVAFERRITTAAAQAAQPMSTKRGQPQSRTRMLARPAVWPARESRLRPVVGATACALLVGVVGCGSGDPESSVTCDEYAEKTC